MKFFIPGPERKLHVQVADRILAERVAGRLKPGQMLPPYRQLAKDYGVGDVTLLAALKELERRGIVTPVHGRGTIVRRDVTREDAPLRAVGIVMHGPVGRLFRYRYLSEICNGIFTVADAIEPGLDVRLLSYRPAGQGPADPPTLGASDLGGLILLGVPDDEATARYARLELPLVVVDHCTPGLKLDFVVVDNAEAVRTLMDHLLELGHRRFAYVEAVEPPLTPTLEWDRLERRRLVGDRLRQAGLACEILEIPRLAGRSGAPEGVRLAQRLREPDAPTALVCYDETTAADVADLLGRHNISFPGDVSLASVAAAGERELAGRLLTSCIINFYKMGHDAMHLLLSRHLKGRPKEPSFVRTPVWLMPGQTAAAVGS